MTCDRTIDPRWAGIIEVLVSGLGGAVKWEPDSVVISLPGRPGVDREADLVGLRLCLNLIDVPVVFAACRVSVPDDSVAELQAKLTESGLTVDVGVVAA